jgi:hypothetical protein
LRGGAGRSDSDNGEKMKSSDTPTDIDPYATRCTPNSTSTSTSTSRRKAGHFKEITIEQKRLNTILLRVLLLSYILSLVAFLCGVTIFLFSLAPDHWAAASKMVWKAMREVTLTYTKTKAGRGNMMSTTVTAVMGMKRANNITSTVKVR